jgi:lipoprotein-anchoring transpeptidase ErfK/SrfK
MRTLAAGLLAAAALAPGLPAQAAAPSAAPVLAPMARPAFVTSVPPSSSILRPYGRSLKVYASPRATSRILITLTNPLLPGVPLVLARYGNTRPGGWIPVSLPVRPNNTIGWVRTANVRKVDDPWRVDVYRAQHKLVVWKGNQVYGVFPVAVGKPSTPTPIGVFYILATIPSFGDFGPVIMATSGFSNVFQTFGPDGGDAATAIHGTNEDYTVGTAASHGCIRMHNAAAALLGRTLPEGTLVRIRH